MRKISRQFAVVINRDGTGDENVNRYCEREGIEIMAKIPNSRIIAEHYSCGELIYQHIPEFRRQLVRIIEYILTLKAR